MKPDAAVQGREEMVELAIAVPRSMLVASAPLTITQRNAEVAIGLSPRGFLELLPAFRSAGGVVSAIGKVRLVDARAFVAWLASRAAAPKPANDAKPKGGVDALAAELGLVKTAGQRR